jgi:hypothetical protein
MLAVVALMAAALTACSNRDNRIAWFQASGKAGFDLKQCGFLWAERRHSNRNSGIISDWRSDQ